MPIVMPMTVRVVRTFRRPRFRRLRIESPPGMPGNAGADTRLRAARPGRIDRRAPPDADPSTSGSWGRWSTPARAEGPSGSGLPSRHGPRQREESGSWFGHRCRVRGRSTNRDPGAPGHAESSSASGPMRTATGRGGPRSSRPRSSGASVRGLGRADPPHQARLGEGCDTSFASDVITIPPCWRRDDGGPGMRRHQRSLPSNGMTRSQGSARLSAAWPRRSMDA